MSDLPFVLDRSHIAESLDEIVEMMQGLNEGDSVRVVSETQDVLARVEGEVDACRDLQEGLILTVPLKVYGDSPTEHRLDCIQWVSSGPVDIGAMSAETERVKRLEVL